MVQKQCGKFHVFICTVTFGQYIILFLAHSQDTGFYLNMNLHLCSGGISLKNGSQ